MRVANVVVHVGDEVALARRAVVRGSGEPWAWLEVGDVGEVSVYGSPAALRRLASELVEAAVLAERARDERARLGAAA
jgi:hypothetical protein